MNYYIDNGCWNSVFAVPGDVVDKYIRMASGNTLKVLLYVLRNSGKEITTEQIADALKIGNDDIRDAFNFWKEVKIINSSTANEENNLSETEDNKTEEPPIPVTPAVPEFTETYNSSTGFHITPTEIEKRRENSKEVRAMFDMAQQTLGNTINHTMVRSLIWQHDYLGLKPEVIMMLLSYCVSIEKTHIAYVEAIALRWSKEEINTLKKAQEEIAHMSAEAKFEKQVCSAFGLKRMPTPKQKKFFDEWYAKGYSADLICCACERMIDTGKTLNVSYINAILENWEKKGIKSRQEADDESNNFKKQTNKTLSSFDDDDEFDYLACTLSKNTKKKP